MVFLWTLGGCGGGGVGHVWTVHVNLLMKDMRLCGCRQVHVLTGGVGWGICSISYVHADACCKFYVWTLHSICHATLRGKYLLNFPGTSCVMVYATVSLSWDFLPAHMILKHKDRGHSTLHPSVTQYVFMWCWRSSLENPDPQRFLEELEALLWPKDDSKHVRAN